MLLLATCYSDIFGHVWAKPNGIVNGFGHPRHRGCSGFQHHCAAFRHTASRVAEAKVKKGKWHRKMYQFESTKMMEFQQIHRRSLKWYFSSCRLADLEFGAEFTSKLGRSSIPHRIHGAGIYANIKGVYWWDPWHTIYSSTVRIRQGFGRSSVTTEMLRMLRCHAPHLWNWAKHSPTFAKIFMISPFRLLLPRWPRWPRWLCRVWWVWLYGREHRKKPANSNVLEKESL